MPHPAQPVVKSENVFAPEEVIRDFFDFAHLPEWEEMLWDWLKATVTGSYPKKLTYRERESVLIMYEKMKALLDAVHSLQQKNTPPKKGWSGNMKGG